MSYGITFDIWASLYYELMSSDCLSVLTFQNLAKHTNFLVEIIFSGVSLGLAAGIIDDSCLLSSLSNQQKVDIYIYNIRKLGKSNKKVGKVRPSEK